MLLKGTTTIVAAPGGEVRIVTTGDARLATAGTGDVLSRRHRRAARAGRPGARAAAAGRLAARPGRRHGPRHGLVAGDLLDLLPAALAEVARP